MRSIRTISTLLGLLLISPSEVSSGPPTGPPLAAKVQIVIHLRWAGMSCRVDGLLVRYEDDGGRRRSVVLTVHLGGFLN